MMSLLGEVCWLETRCSAQAAKSSNTFCLRCRDPALRQSMPYSPPPLQTGTQTGVQAQETGWCIRLGWLGD